jgi:hypothetical protein
MNPLPRHGIFFANAGFFKTLINLWGVEMNKSLALLLLVLAATPSLAADERYQVVSIPEAGRPLQSGGAHAKVFILDTAEGHMWTWGENDFLPGGDRKLGSALIYQGRLKPGKQAGEIIESIVK